jgi:hypothetical protein
MRHSALTILLSAIFSTAALAQSETEVPVMKGVPPAMTAVQPVNPVSSKPGAPIIQSVSAQTGGMAILPNSIISAQFHFVAPNGNAAVLHREVVTTSGTNANPAPNQAINIPPDQQKQGGTVSVLLSCTDNRYFETFRAYIIDAEGNRSNELQYTVHCNGG